MQRLPDSRPSPYGLELRIARGLPLAALASLIIPLLFVLFSTWTAPEGDPQQVEKHLTWIRILGVAFVLTGWTAVLTVGIGCAVVWIMKGPAYVADRYNLSDAEQPRSGTGDDRRSD